MTSALGTGRRLAVGVGCAAVAAGLIVAVSKVGPRTPDRPPGVERADALRRDLERDGWVARDWAANDWAKQVVEWRDESGRPHRPTHGLLGCSWVALAPPITVPAGEELALRVRVKSPPAATCSFQWLNGSVEPFNLCSGPPTVTLMGPLPPDDTFTFRARPAHELKIVYVGRLFELVENGTVSRHWYQQPGRCLLFDKPVTH